MQLEGKHVGQDTDRIKPGRTRSATPSGGARRSFAEYLAQACRPAVPGAGPNRAKARRRSFAVFFEQCDAREQGREPDWEEHLAVIAWSRVTGLAAPMIFVNTNVFMYAVGRDHPLKDEARAFLISAVADPAVWLSTSVEALQELLHAYPGWPHRNLRCSAPAGAVGRPRDLAVGSKGRCSGT